MATGTSLVSRTGTLLSETTHLVGVLPPQPDTPVPGPLFIEARQRGQFSDSWATFTFGKPSQQPQLSADLVCSRQTRKADASVRTDR